MNLMAEDRFTDDLSSQGFCACACGQWLRLGRVQESLFFQFGQSTRFQLEPQPGLRKFHNSITLMAIFAMEGRTAAVSDDERRAV